MLHPAVSCVSQVVFPSVGQLVRNKAGRIEFVFDRALVEALELGLGPVSSGSGGLLA
jgi:hypothetical protein